MDAAAAKLDGAKSKAGEHKEWAKAKAGEHTEWARTKAAEHSQSAKEAALSFKSKAATKENTLDKINIV